MQPKWLTEYEVHGLRAGDIGEIDANHCQEAAGPHCFVVTNDPVPERRLAACLF
jgi:hypothetical protein